MLSIPVRVCGDQWMNYEEVHTLLSNHQAHEAIELDLRHEGPSLRALGLLDLITKLQVPHRKITVKDFANQKETLPFARKSNQSISHFVTNNDHYWLDHLAPVAPDYLFGYFMGRPMISRAVMMHDICRQFSHDFLVSCMASTALAPWENDIGINLEKFLDWVNPTDSDQFMHWWQHNRPKSIDNHAVHDQYDLCQNTNKDLLVHYSRFVIELTAETFTLGESFFMTEKTVRPLMAAKPVLIYASKNFLANLRELGFRTWSDHWDEDYDKFQGPMRWNMMKKTIKQILSRDDRADLMIAIQDIANHNRHRLIEIKQQSKTNSISKN